MASLNLRELLDRLALNVGAPFVPVDETATQTLSNKTLTSPVLNTPTINDPILAKSAVVSFAAAGPTAITAAAHAGKTLVMNRATGVSLTLPAATGTGNTYVIFVGTTFSGGSGVIAVASSSDYMRGQAFAVANADGTAKAWQTANTGTLATESDTITLNGGTKGGIQGDVIELTDIASGVWSVQIFTKNVTTEANPFSVAV